MERTQRLLVRLLPERVGRAVTFLQAAEPAYDSVPDRRVPSLARELLVATIDPATGKIWNNARYAVPTAALVELAYEGRLDVAVYGRKRKVKLSLRDAAPLGDPELDDAMLTIGSGFLGSRLTMLVDSMPQTEQFLRRLVKEGAVVEETHRRFGITTRRYRTTPSSGREQIAARIRSALLGESIPDDRTARLISSLVDVDPKVFVEKPRVGEARRRAEEIRASIGEDERAIVHAVGQHMTDHDG